MAGSLERQHRDTLDQHAGELAYHFAGAQTVLGSEKLVYFSSIAGEQAIETFSYEQVMVHFDNVLAAKEGLAVDSERAAALFGLGRAQTAVLPRHELELAHENLSRAFEYYASVGDTAQVVAVAFEFYAPQLSEQGLMTGGLVERALDLVPAGSLDAGRLHAYRGNILGLGQGDYQSARDSLDRALTIAKQEGNAALEIRALITSAQLEAWNNHFEDGLAYGLTAIEKAVAASDLRGEVTAWYWACLGSFFSGDTQETERQSSIFLESADRLRDRNWGAAAHESVARPFMLWGEWQSAREMVQAGLDQMLQDPRTLLQRVVLEAQTGERDQAEFHLDLMEQIAQRAASGANTPNGLLAYAAPVAKYILGALKKPGLGESSITAVLSSPVDIPFFSMFARIGASLSAVMEKDAEAAGAQYAVLCSSNARMYYFTSFDRILGLLAGTMGKLDNAVAHFEKGREYCREAGYRPELAWICHDHAAVLLELGARRDRTKAAALLDECLSIASELGMSPLMAKAAAVQEMIGADPGRSTSYPGGLSLR